MIKIFAKKVFSRKIFLQKSPSQMSYMVLDKPLIFRKRLTVLDFRWRKIATSSQKIKFRYHLSRNWIPILSMGMCSDWNWQIKSFFFLGKQRRIQNPVIYLRWSFLLKWKTDFLDFMLCTPRCQYVRITKNILLA